MQYNILKTPIEYLKGVGPAKADLLKKELHIFTYQDLLFHYPYRYADRSKFYKINEIKSVDVEVQVIGVITSAEELGQKRGKRLVAKFRDATGTVDLVWFKGIKWIKNSLKLNTPYILYAKPSIYNGIVNFAHPELELKAEADKSLQTGLQPVYSTTEKLIQKGLTNKAFARLTKALLPQLKNQIQESLTEDIRIANKLPPKESSLFAIHFPTNQEQLRWARYRMKFEELFFLQLNLLIQKQVNQTKMKGYAFPRVDYYFNTFFKEHLPFELTGAQKKVLKEIRSDIGTGKHMNRLVQGDVGSGKTMVALMSMLIALDNGFQACLMAPTEILATQHYNGLNNDIGDMPMRIELLTGSTKTARRKEIHEGLLNGEIHILVGTHALLEEKVQFKNLGLAVIDEQHRFGVAQRSKLWLKNKKPPHVLVMTATPIPRTLAMSLYGDLDISVIDELPPGRKPITTVHRFDKNRLKVFGFLKEEIAKGRQVYIVYPLIEESAKMDYKNLDDGYESIKRAFPLPEYAISIVHGRMNAADKEYEMQRFVKGETQIMVATTVIEVGVNVPNASVMVIESAERFGLSQLHQLRGRVGRGAEKSFCILITSYKLSEDGRTRMETMVRTNDGFEVADVDLKLRGPGDLMGTRQSGMLDLKIADIAKDGPILTRARDSAIQLLKEDHNLSLPKHLIIRNEYLKKYRGKMQWSRIS
ncbi:MAG: ATP-dependent DNA helicase RecG [Schleiferiaceae bacterium]|nr:ATP-dependent DNA helicase RecG [Schleiferiaceae bacterium]